MAASQEEEGEWNGERGSRAAAVFGNGERGSVKQESGSVNGFRFDGEKGNGKGDRFLSKPSGF
jgi:hypothetical protein